MDAEALPPSLAELAERHLKRSRTLMYHFQANMPEFTDGYRAHLASKVRAEYEGAMVLPDAIQAQQGGSAPQVTKGKTSESAEILSQIEKERKAAQRPPVAGASQAVALRSSLAHSTAASHLQQALVPQDDASRDTSRSMLSSALIRKKELAAQQAKPAYHAPWKLMRVISGHLGWVRCVAVEPNNQWFATGAGDRIIKIWDMASGELKLSLTGHISTVRGLAVSHRHPYLFSAGEDKLVKCWDLETNKVVRQYYGHLSGIYALSLHPTLDVVVTAGRDASARVWDMRTKTQIHVLGGHRGTVASVQCQESDPQVITGSMDATVKLWDLAAGRCMTTLTHHKKSVRALAIPPHEFTFASGSAGGRNIKRWRCPEGTLMTNMTHDAIVNTLSINADGVLFSGADDGTMQFYDYATGVPFQAASDIVQPGSLDAEAGLFCSTFDQTGTRLITGLRVCD
ncbi:pre-mRNA-splicing factor prp46 [Malassezia nana]|uniref:Pre-mRNA-splicing factor PRP46 n=1 Tax=Malassezia nana TaxID=180528 RepID=A0AAF0J3S2_9BASI|nr:pre-mRNA-splicing factor prp46 [Malassezia nana]